MVPLAGISDNKEILPAPCLRVNVRWRGCSIPAPTTYRRITRRNWDGETFAVQPTALVCDVGEVKV